MKKIADLTLIKLLGKGSFGEVYLSQREGRKEFFATKQIDRSFVYKKNLQQYLDNELSILKTLNHPNIVKFEYLLTTEKHYYITMEFINGGDLSTCLKKYIEKYKMPFPEEIVQHLMRQILYALLYIHKKKIIHRDLKLDNIMVHFDTRADKENLNMMKAKIKIIDFGIATKLLAENNYETKTAIGTFNNMAPTILNKFTPNGDKNKGYNEKCDIWSIGTICYELLTGKNLFNVDTFEELIDRMNKGDYTLPNNVSKEVASFLIGMLQYDSKKRLSIEQLLEKPFLTKNVKYFEKIDTVYASKILNSKIKENIEISNKINVQGNNQLTISPIPEESIEEKRQLGNNINRFNSKEESKNNINNNINNKLHKYNSAKKIHKNYPNNLITFYGQNFPSNALLQTPKKPRMGKGVGIPLPPKRIPQQQKVIRTALPVEMPYYYPRNLTPLKNDRSNSYKNPNYNFIIKM